MLSIFWLLRVEGFWQPSTYYKSHHKHIELKIVMEVAGAYFYVCEGQRSATSASMKV